MSRRVIPCVRTVGLAAVANILILAPSLAGAQTTVVLDAPDTEVTDSYLRGGSSANTVHNTDAVATKANLNIANVRRALLKFDTETHIPQGSTIQSARLSLTLKRSDPETRRIGIYRVTQSFQESQATWNTRKTGYLWNSSGGDLSSRLGEFIIGTSVGSKVTVDVTSLVQATVKGTYGSRYTRIALVDTGTASNTSYKEFHSSEASDPSVRPTMTVVYGSASAPLPPPVSTSRLKVLHWNLHHGVGTDGRYDLVRIATEIANMGPDIISLNEVERYTSYGNEDQPARYAALLGATTGRTWYYYFRVGSGASTGIGNMVLSRFPIASTSYCQLSASRVAANVAVQINGRLFHVWSTHLDSSTSNSLRIAEVRVLQSCAASFAEQKVIAGDFNGTTGTTEIGLMTDVFSDAWAEAAADGTAVSYPGNTSFGATRNSRIDYAFLSKGATALAITHAEVFDTRDANGFMPSDHKPLVVTFEIR